MEELNIRQNFGKAFDVLESTIGFDLISVSPQTKEEYEKYQEQLDKEKEQWRKDHPEQVAKIEEFNKKINSKKPYILAPWEREIIKKILKMNDISLDSCTISIMDDGEISVSTCKKDWFALAGREWWINIPNETCKCVAMS